MRILSVTAQKPDSTGSGTYLTELVNSFKLLGHTQAVIAGINVEDTDKFIDGVLFYPVRYNTCELPFNVLGMSDSMPYEST
ncbi:MAG: glycosyl transferase family 1, partial [Oscillospiraceae bacterium]